MTRRAVIAVDFDVTYPGQAEHEARILRTNLPALGLRNVEVTVLDPGTTDHPPAPAGGQAQEKASTT